MSNNLILLLVLLVFSAFYSSRSLAQEAFLTQPARAFWQYFLPGWHRTESAFPGSEMFVRDSEHIDETDSRIWLFEDNEKELKNLLKFASLNDLSLSHPMILPADMGILSPIQVWSHPNGHIFMAVAHLQRNRQAVMISRSMAGWDNDLKDFASLVKNYQDGKSDDNKLASERQLALG